MSIISCAYYHRKDVHELRFHKEAVRGEDKAQSLEAKAREALACPCVAELRDGPCGKEFSNAFVCFIKSEEPEQGSDCVAPFLKMQHCMLANTAAFAKADKAEDSEETEDGRAEQNDDIFIHDPPKAPNDKIRLPLWYIQSKETE